MWLQDSRLGLSVVSATASLLQQLPGPSCQGGAQQPEQGWAAAGVCLPAVEQHRIMTGAVDFAVALDVYVHRCSERCQVLVVLGLRWFCIVTLV